jgi:hypothetical protein
MADSACFPRGTRVLSRAVLTGIFFVSWQMALAAPESKGLSEQKIVEYVDSTYGAKIRHLQKDDGHEHNLYYYRNPWNADSSHMVGIQSDLQQKDWRVVLYDGDGRFLRELFPISQFDWRLVWDRDDPHLLYTWHSSRLYRFHVDTGQSDLLKDFAPLSLKPNGPSLNETSDRLLVATSDGVLRSYRLPALDEERTFMPSVPAGCFLSWDKPHYIGHENYIDMAYSSATSGQEAIVVYDDTGKVVHTFDGIGGGGHYTFSSDGRLAYFRLPVAPRRGPEKPLEVHVVNLDGTDDRVLVSIPWAKAAHVQNLHLAWPSKVKDWFIASFFPLAGNVPTTYSAPLDEILQVRTDGTWKYLARTGTVYSHAGARGATGDMFWAQPLASPSNDGRRIGFNSNRAGTIDQYILYTEP